MSKATDNFCSHVNDECDKCDPYVAVCPIGAELLWEAIDDLDEDWQRFAHGLSNRERLDREAEANFKYYEGSEEF